MNNGWDGAGMGGRGRHWDEQGYIAHKSMEHVAAKTGQEGYSTRPNRCEHVSWIENECAQSAGESGHTGRRCSGLRKSSVARKDKTGWWSTLLEWKGNLTGFTFRLCRAAGHLKDLTYFSWQQEGQKGAWAGARGAASRNEIEMKAKQ